MGFGVIRQEDRYAQLNLASVVLFVLSEILTIDQHFDRRVIRVAAVRRLAFFLASIPVPLV
jgi:hypothetical protein